jgi:hypothetical protein
MSAPRLTFRQYLRQQRLRNDPVGDLARDVAHDPALYRVRLTPPRLALHLHQLTGVCDGALTALGIAWLEYRDRAAGRATC